MLSPIFWITAFAFALSFTAATFVSSEIGMIRPDDRASGPTKAHGQSTRVPILWVVLSTVSVIVFILLFQDIIAAFGVLLLAALPIAIPILAVLALLRPRQSILRKVIALISAVSGGALSLVAFPPYASELGVGSLFYFPKSATPLPSPVLFL